MKKRIVAAFTAALMVVSLMVVNGPVLAQDDYNYDDAWEDEWDDWEQDWDSYYDTYDESYDMTDEEAATLMGFFAIYFGVIACISLVGYIYMALTLSTIGKKLGEDKNWMAWVPIANFLYIAKLAGFSSWLGLLMFVPLLNFFFGIYAMYKIAERRGFQGWIALLTLVPLVGIAVPAYLAWGNPGKTTQEMPDPLAGANKPQPAETPESPAEASKE